MRRCTVSTQHGANLTNENCSMKKMCCFVHRLVLTPLVGQQHRSRSHHICEKMTYSTAVINTCHPRHAIGIYSSALTCPAHMRMRNVAASNVAVEMTVRTPFPLPLLLLSFCLLLRAAADGLLLLRRRFLLAKLLLLLYVLLRCPLRCRAPRPR